MSRYKITFQCQICGGKFSKIVADPQKAKLKCLNQACKHVQVTRGLDLDAGTSPGIVGATTVRAVDKTAEIVMADYGLSNLKDNIREGENCAPSLPPHQQRLADGLFGGKAMAQRAGINKRQMDVLGRRAMAGAFRNMALDVKQVLPDSSVALHSVGKTT